MKTKKEISDKYKAFLTIQLNASVTKHKEEVDTTIAVLLWVLQCNECKKYPCVCNDPF